MCKRFSYCGTLGLMLSDICRVDNALFPIRSEIRSDRAAHWGAPFRFFFWYFHPFSLFYIHSLGKRLSAGTAFFFSSIETAVSIELYAKKFRQAKLFGSQSIKTEIHGPGRILLTCGQFTLCSRFLCKFRRAAICCQMRAAARWPRSKL